METIIVLAILGVAVAAGGWSFYKNVTGKKSGCNCGGNCNLCSKYQSSASSDEKQNFLR